MDKELFLVELEAKRASVREAQAETEKLLVLAEEKGMPADLLAERRAQLNDAVQVKLVELDDLEKEFNFDAELDAFFKDRGMVLEVAIYATQTEEGTGRTVHFSSDIFSGTGAQYARLGVAEYLKQAAKKINKRSCKQ